MANQEDIDKILTNIVVGSHGIGFLEGYNKFKTNLQIMVEEYDMESFTKEQVLEMIMYQGIKREQEFNNRTMFYNL